MAEIAGGTWSYCKCPCRDVSIARTDLGTLWLVRFDDPEHKVKGEIGICQGKQAKAHARLFHAAPDLLEAACSVIDWHDALDGKMDTKHGQDAIDKLRAAVVKALGTASPAPPPAAGPGGHA